jgi:hypothetical protein
MNGIPVIKIELEHMKHSILHAFSQHVADTDSMVKSAVEKFCTPENLQRILDNQVEAVLKAAIQEEVGTFFRYGDGRAFLRKAVTDQLEKNYL